MRFKRHTELEHGLRSLDVTPLIDMIFQLLIFFMLTSSFIIQPGIKINLPKAVTSEVSEARNLLITVSRENVVYIDKKIVTNKELKASLGNACRNKMAVLIMSDQRANLGKVVEIWDMARDSGIEQVNIAADRE